MSSNYKPRSGQDRRSKDSGPSGGWKERRRNPERRMPEVEEISIAEFKRLMSENGLPADNSTEQALFDWGGVRKL